MQLWWWDDTLVEIMIDALKLQTTSNSSHLDRQKIFGLAIEFDMAIPTLILLILTRMQGSNDKLHMSLTFLAFLAAHGREGKKRSSFSRWWVSHFKVISRYLRHSLSSKANLIYFRWVGRWWQRLRRHGQERRPNVETERLEFRHHCPPSCQVPGSRGPGGSARCWACPSRYPRHDWLRNG